MEQKPKREDAECFIQRLGKSAIKQQCWSCDCFQGLLTQLEIDCDDNITDLTLSRSLAKRCTATLVASLAHLVSCLQGIFEVYRQK